MRCLKQQAGEEAVYQHPHRQDGGSRQHPRRCLVRLLDVVVAALRTPEEDVVGRLGDVGDGAGAGGDEEELRQLDGPRRPQTLRARDGVGLQDGLVQQGLGDEAAEEGDAHDAHGGDTPQQAGHGHLPPQPAQLEHVQLVDAEEDGAGREKEEPLKKA